VDGERALGWTRQPPPWVDQPTTVEFQTMLRRGVFWNLLELSFTVFVNRITCCSSDGLFGVYDNGPRAVLWINPPHINIHQSSWNLLV
jgi:hypothetical protein